jgi:hypothetical protein
MGFDVSFHPVDLDLIQKRLVPYLMGQGGIDDLVERAVRIARVRHRANAWGLGALKLTEGLDESAVGFEVLEMELGQDPNPEGIDGLDEALLSESDDSDFPDALRGDDDLYADDVEGSGIIVSPSFADGQRESTLTENGTSERQPLVDSDLYVWGRPFFVTAPDPVAVSEIIDRYLDANLEVADSIAKSELGRLDPELVESVQPDLEEDLPSDEELAQGIRWKLDLLRRCYAAQHAGERSVTLPDGEEADPCELLAREVPLALLEFAANFRPGWMARGMVWPTVLLQEAALDDAGAFESPRALVEPLARELSDVSFFLEPTITENYMVGGYVPKEKVPELRAHLEQHRERVLARAREAGWEHDCLSALQKIQEALADAERRGLGFAEATEIYSGIQGIMN